MIAHPEETSVNIPVILISPPLYREDAVAFADISSIIPNIFKLPFNALSIVNVKLPSFLNSSPVTYKPLIHPL